MAMSDCPHCWETPCVCGKDYETWSTQRLEKLKEVLERELQKRKNK